MIKKINFFNSYYKKLILLFIVLFVTKLAIALLIKPGILYGDEWRYSTCAQSIAYFNKDYFWLETLHLTPPLYPLCISPAFLVDNIRTSFILIDIINCFLITLSIFPIWLISREFLSEKKSMQVVILTSILPFMLIFPSWIKTENLFVPLFLFAFYFTYKAFIQKNNKFAILSGIFWGLCILTRIITYGLMISLLILLVLYIVVSFKQFKNSKLPERIVLTFKKSKKVILIFSLVCTVALITILPMVIRNYLYVGFNLKTLLGIYSGNVSVSSITSNNYPFLRFLYWMFFYFDYLIIASGTILFPFIYIQSKQIRKIKNDKFKTFLIFFWILLILLIMIVAHHNIGKSIVGENIPIPLTDINSPFLTTGGVTHYCEAIIPLVVLVGFISLIKYSNNPIGGKEKTNLLKIFIIVSILISFFGAVINTSSNYLAFTLGLRYVIQSFCNSNILLIFICSLLLFLFPIIGFYLFVKNKKLFFAYFCAFMILLSISIGVILYVVKDNLSDDQMKIGFWLEENASEDDVILFDNEDNSYWFYRISPFIKNNIIWGNITEDIDKADYIISTWDLNFTVVEETNISTYDGYDGKLTFYLYEI